MGPLAQATPPPPLRARTGKASRTPSCSKWFAPSSPSTRPEADPLGSGDALLVEHTENDDYWAMGRRQWQEPPGAHPHEVRDELRRQAEQREVPVMVTHRSRPHGPQPRQDRAGICDSGMIRLAACSVPPPAASRGPRSSPRSWAMVSQPACRSAASPDRAVGPHPRQRTRRSRLGQCRRRAGEKAFTDGRNG